MIFCKEIVIKYVIRFEWESKFLESFIKGGVNCDYIRLLERVNIERNEI